MKKFLEKKISVKSLLVLVVVVITMTVAIAAVGTRVTATLSPNISITYNGVYVTPVDGLGNITYPLVYNNTTYLPVRAISTILGVDIGWNQQTQTVSLNTGGGAVQPPVVQPPVTQPTTIPSAGGTVSVNGTTTNFSFTPNQTGAWQFRTSNHSNGCDPYLTLKNSAGATLAEDDDRAGDLNSLIVCYLTAGTTYTINAGFYLDNTGTYTLTASLAPTIPAAGGSVGVNGPTYYVFIPNQSGIWTFSSSNNGNTLPFILVSENDGHYIGDDLGSGVNHNVELSVPLVAGRTYIIEASLAWDSPGGIYTLTASRLTPQVMPPSGGIVTVNGRTYYSFVPTQSGTWLFITSNSTGGCDPYLTLYDANFSQLAFDDDGAGYPHARLTYHLNAGTTYYVYAGYFGMTGGTYTLGVSRV